MADIDIVAPAPIGVTIHPPLEGLISVVEPIPLKYGLLSSVSVTLTEFPHQKPHPGGNRYRPLADANSYSKSQLPKQLSQRERQAAHRARRATA